MRVVEEVVLAYNHRKNELTCERADVGMEAEQEIMPEHLLFKSYMGSTTEYKKVSEGQVCSTYEPVDLDNEVETLPIVVYRDATTYLQFEEKRDYE